MTAQPRDPIASGERIAGRYRIESFLAAGGMGEVYAAVDESLGRRVAIKVLPHDRASDPARMQRFLREAQASSALQHPSIVTVYDSGSSDEHTYIVMELIEGQRFSDWMRRRRDLPRALEVMAQVADGLARAHAAGIVHRDLKPDNIMVTRGGFAKILDFGIAKLLEPAEGRRADFDTAPDAMLGTAAYMSPEQVEGRVVDHRSDVFSFGAVLYEAVTSRSAFRGLTAVDTMHNVLHVEPSLDDVDADFARILRRCLAKDPNDRYHAMRDIALDLRESRAAGPRRITSRRVRWGVLTVAPLLAAAFLWVNARMDSAPAGVAVPLQTTMLRVTNSGKVASAAMSPDGRYVVYAASEGLTQSIWVKQIATGTTVRIFGPDSAQIRDLQVSRDGNYVYYAATPLSEPNIAHAWQLSILGGLPRRVAVDTDGNFGLSPDGTRLVFRRFNAFDREYRLTVAAVDGSTEDVVLRKKYPEFINAPIWSSDNAITYISGSAAPPARGGIYELNLDTDAVTKIDTPAWAGVGSMAWLPDGSGLLVTAFDREQPPQVWFIPRGKGAPRKITSDISSYSSIHIAADGQSFSAVRDEPDANVIVVRTDDPQKITHITTGIGNGFGYAGVSWLPDGRLLFSARVLGKSAFLAAPAGGGTPMRISPMMNVWHPVPSPDGERIAFTSDHSGQVAIWTADLDGGDVTRVTVGDRSTRAHYMPDGQSLVFVTTGATQYAFVAPVHGGPVEQLTDVPTSRAYPSPDGQWLLCRLRSPDVEAGPRWRTALVRFGSSVPVRNFDVPRYGADPEFQWAADGKSFAFVDEKDGAGNIWLQPIDGGEPRQLTHFESGSIFAYDMSRDGQSIAVSRGNPLSDVVLIRDFR